MQQILDSARDAGIEASEGVEDLTVAVRKAAVAAAQAAILLFADHASAGDQPPPNPDAYDFQATPDGGVRIQTPKSE